MEFVDGKNVRQLLARADKKKAKIPIEISCFIASETAKGLEYAHNFADEKTGQPLELVHRDMSPQNVMLGYEAGVKIVDFGIAKAAARSGHTKAGVLKGKFGYMSPEQAQGMNIDRRTDIFALGIILFELLTQRRLFTSDDDMKTLQLVKECRVPRPSKYNPNVSPQLDSIVLKTLRKERGERYGSAAELYADLSHFMNHKYPRFLSTDMSNFIKGLFSEDIVEERKKRERYNAEIPAVLNTPFPQSRSANGAASAPSSTSDDRTRNTDATPIDTDMPTQLARGGMNDSSSLKTNATESHSENERATEQTATPYSGGGVVMTPGEFMRARNDGAPSAPAEPNDFLKEGGTVTGEGVSGNSDVGEFELPSSLHVRGSIGSRPRPSPGRPDFFGREESHSGLPLGNSKSLPLMNSGVHAAPPPPSMRAVRMRPSGSSSAHGSSRASKIRIISASVILLVVGFKLLFGAPSSQDGASQPVRTIASPDPSPTVLPTEAQPSVPDSKPPQTALSQDNPDNPVIPVPPLPKKKEPDEVGRSVGSLDPGENLKGAKIVLGYITINSFPRATEIYVDGKLLRNDSGRALETPIKQRTLRIGSHHVELKNSFYGVEWSGQVQVERDKISSVDVVLSK
jgi:hypothetical protein